MRCDDCGRVTYTNTVCAECGAELYAYHACAPDDPVLCDPCLDKEWETSGMLTKEEKDEPTI